VLEVWWDLCKFPRDHARYGQGLASFLTYGI